MIKETVRTRDDEQNIAQTDEVSLDISLQERVSTSTLQPFLGRVSEDLSEFGTSDSLPELMQSITGQNEALFKECTSRAPQREGCRLLGETTKTMELELLFNFMAKISCTRAGKELIGTMMTSPPKDKETIDDIQHAVQELVKSTGSTATIKKLLTSVQKTLIDIQKFRVHSIGDRFSNAESMIEKYVPVLEDVQKSIERTRKVIQEAAALNLQSPPLARAVAQIQKCFFNPEVDDVLGLSVPPSGEINLSVGYETQTLTGADRASGLRFFSVATVTPSVALGFLSLINFAMRGSEPFSWIAGIVGAGVLIIGGICQSLEWTGESIVKSFLSDTSAMIAKVFDKGYKQDKVSDSLAVLDYCQTLATIGESNLDKMVMPRIKDGDLLTFKYRAIRNALMEIQGRECVPNDFEMEEGAPIVMTGPNSGGKSMLCRSVLFDQIMGQMGSYVYAEEADMTIAHSIAFQVPAQNSVTDAGGRYASELKSTMAMLDQCTARSLTVLDEMTQGTESKAGRTTAVRLLGAFAAKGGGTIFVTHDLDLARELMEKGIVRAYQLEYDGEDPTHKIIPGVAESSHSERVDEQLGATEDQILHSVLESSSSKAQFEKWMESTRS